MSDVITAAFSLAVVLLWFFYDRRALKRRLEATWTMRAKLTADDVQKVAYVLGKEGKHREQDKLLLTVQQLREWARENDGLAIKRARERVAIKKGSEQ